MTREKASNSGCVPMLRSLRLEFVALNAVISVVIAPIAYMSSSVVARIVLVTAFVSVLVSLALAYHMGRDDFSSSILFLASLLFLLYRSSFATYYYVENTMNSRPYLFANQYREEGRLVFDEAHSYFFLPSSILYFLQEISSISPVDSVYASLLICGVFAALIAVTLLKSMQRQEQTSEKRARSILPPIVALAFMSFIYSERGIIGGGFAPISLLLMLLLMCLLFDRGLKNRSRVATMLLLVVGVTFGSTDGIMLLTLFFILFSIFSGRRTIVVNALIPLGFMMYAGYLYTVSLRSYVTHAWEGFWEFLQRLITGDPWQRVFPWGRTISLTTEDAFVASAAYLSLLLLSLVGAFTTTYILLRDKTKDRTDNPDIDACLWSISLSLWLTLSLASLTYIGASIKPELAFSDIRTIAIVFPSLLVPFLFVSRRLISKVTRQKIFLTFIISLLALASVRTTYEVYPKSLYDPINVVEDARLSSTSIYMAGAHIRSYCEGGGIVADYKVLNRIGRLLSPNQYDKRYLDEGVLTEPFGRFPDRSMLVFNVAGISYPSTYHRLGTYLAAYEFGMSTHANRLYDNGAALITTHKQRSVSSVLNGTREPEQTRVFLWRCDSASEDAHTTDLYLPNLEDSAKRSTDFHYRLSQ